MTIGFTGFIVFAALQPYIFSNPTDSSKVLEKQGYTNVKFIGVDYWGCGKGDVKNDKFEVTNSAGNRFSVTVCSGFLKGSTVRY